MHISYVLSALAKQQDQTNYQMNKLAGNVFEENTAFSFLICIQLWQLCSLLLKHVIELDFP